MRRTLILLLWILGAPQLAPSQVLRITNSSEKFHGAPSGTVLGTLLEGASLQAGAERDAWREVTLEGWIWGASVRADRRPGFDLVVSAANGENLRASPNGERIARLENGTLMVQVAREGRWIRVRRSGWVRAADLAGEADSTATNPQLATEGVAEEAAAPLQASADDGTTTNGLAWTGQAGTKLLNAPGGDTLANISPMAAIEVLERQGNWSRIRVEGWAWTPSLGTPADTGQILSGIAPEVLRSNPEAFRGRIIEWQVQFISLDRAEKIRTDFTEGELFILARPPGDQPGFVYLAVPEEQLARVRSLTPLQRITVLARVRTGRSAQMTAPILELLEIR
jgi:hypothetical protein